jgi:gas vesicle protein
MGVEQSKRLGDFGDKLTKNVRNLLKELHKSHQQMSDEQAKGLSDFVNDLTRDVSTMINAFAGARGEMSKELKSKLADDVKNMGAYTKSKLKEFEASHKMMSDALRKSLAAYVNDMSRGVGKLMQEYSTDMDKTRTSWAEISSTVAGLNTEADVPPGKYLEEVPIIMPTEFIAQEEIEKEGPEEQSLLPEEEIEEKVLEYINGHPEGVKVGTMELALDVPRMRLGLKAKKLLEEGRVRKENNLYFPLQVFQG